MGSWGFKKGMNMGLPKAASTCVSLTDMLTTDDYEQAGLMPG